MTAVLRANGSKKIGMGHLSRSALIAAAFERKGDAVTVVHNEDEDAKRFLSARTTSLAQVLPSGSSLAAELKILKEVVRSSAASVFVLDVLNYAEYFDFLSSLKRENCSTVVIYDEVEKKQIPADIVLNGNPCQSENNCQGVSGRYLLGPRYFLMDPGYRNVMARAPQRKVKNILVTVGGSDHNDLIFKLIAAIEAQDEKYHAKIFSTSSTGYVDRLKSRLAQSKLSSELFLDQKSLLPFWSECDVAITAGGNTLFERIAARLPGATLCQLDLQMKIAEAFERRGVNMNLGMGKQVSEKKLARKLGEFLNDFEAQQKQYVKSADLKIGRGLDYLMEAVNELR